MATVKRNPHFKAALQQQKRGLVEFAMVTYTDQVRADIQASSPSGRLYIIGGRAHIASAPGQPPAVFTGDLFRHIAYAVTVQGSEVVGSAGVLAPIDYAKGLEYGTSRIQPRPVWRPAIPKAMRTLRQAMAGGRTFVGRP